MIDLWGLQGVQSNSVLAITLNLKYSGGDYKGFVRGYTEGSKTAALIGAGFTPADIPLDIYEGYQSYQSGSWAGVGLSALSVIGLDFIKDSKRFGEALTDATSTAARKELSKINLGELSGNGADALNTITNKVNNIGDHLTGSDLTGAVKDIFGQPVTINGKVYNHLGEVQDALGGLGNQLNKLNKLVDSGDLSGDVLDAATSLRTQIQNQKDQIQNVLNNAWEAVDGLK
jgi:hypothetical protein